MCYPSAGQARDAAPMPTRPGLRAGRPDWESRLVPATDRLVTVALRRVAWSPSLDPRVGRWVCDRGDASAAWGRMRGNILHSGVQMHEFGSRRIVVALAVALVALVIPETGHAQTGKIAGVVTDAASGEPIAGV